MTRTPAKIATVAAALVLLPVAGTAASASGGVSTPDNPLRSSEAQTLKLPTIGKLAVEPPTGRLDSYPTVTTAGGCPKGIATLTKIFGPGFQADGENVIGNTETWEFGSPPADRMVAPFTITLQEAADRQKLYRNLPVPTLDGVYQIVMTCRDPLPEYTGAEYMFANYIGKVRISGQTYTSLTTVADLPKVPRPKAGQEALANPAPESALQAKRDEEELPEFLESIKAGNTAASPKPDSNSAMALTAGAGVLLGGLALLYGLSRRGTGGRR